MDKDMDMDISIIQMVQNMKDFGVKTIKMELPYLLMNQARQKNANLKMIGSYQKLIHRI